MKHKALFCVILAMCLLFLAGCVPSKKYFSMKDAGLLPTNADLPNTKWVCQEMDMYFYILKYRYLAGEYTINGTTYTINGYFRTGWICLEAQTTEASSTIGDAYIEFSRNSIHGLGSEYVYENNAIRFLSVDYFHMPENVTLPKTLTFVPEGKIAQTVEARWYAQEIDLYMDSFTDAKNYFEGVLTHDGVEYPFEAFKASINNSYFFYLPYVQVTGPDDFYLHLAYDQEQDAIIGTLYSGFQKNIGYYDGPTITFTKVMPE